MFVFFLGQLRLERMNFDPKIIPRAKMSVEPVLSRLGIDTKQEKPALLHKPEGGPKQPAKIFFPPLSPSKRKFDINFTYTVFPSQHVWDQRKIHIRMCIYAKYWDIYV